MISFQVFILIIFLELLIIFMVFRDIISPPVLFSIIFFIVVCMLSIFEKYWAVSIQPITFYIVTGSIALFALGSFIPLVIGGFFSRTTKASINFKPIIIDKSIITFFKCFYILTDIIMILFVIVTARRYSGTNNLLSMIGIVNALLKDSNLTFPPVFSTMVTITVDSSYVWLFITVYNYIANKKIDKVTLKLLIISLLCSILSGSRGEAISAIIIGAITYINIIKCTGRLKRIKLRTIVKLLIGMVVVVAIFQELGSFLGRDAKLYTPFEYIEIYLAGPLLNFNNHYIYMGDISKLFGEQTLINFYTSLVSLTRNKKFLVESPLTYFQANFHNTGNVATVFYPLYYDFGLAGTFLVMFILGILMQLFYFRMMKSIVNSNRTFTLSEILYPYLLFLFLRSFFDNSFFRFLCNFRGVVAILIWYLLSKYLTTTKIKVKN